MLNIKLSNGEIVSVKPIQYHKMSLLDGSSIIVKNFNPYHDTEGRFATAPGGGGGLLTDKTTTAEINSMAKKYYPNGIKTANVKNGDVLLKQMFADVKFNGLPVTVSKADYKEAIKSYPELIRGVPKASYKKDFIEGALHRPGAGYFGSGTYFAMDKTQASSYGKYMFNAALSPKAKVVKHKALQKEMSKFLKTNKNSKAAIALVSNAGRFATLRGYDAIQVLNDNSVKAFQQVVVLNRSAVVLEGNK